IRLPMMGTGVIITMIIAILFTAIILYVRPRLENKALKARVYTYSALSFGYSVLSFWLPSVIFDFGELSSFPTYSAVLTGSTFF
ncbi:hypothetical protein R0J90_19465, partial [Micrococcus sp. SIMBA_144]